MKEKYIVAETQSVFQQSVLPNSKAMDCIENKYDEISGTVSYHITLLEWGFDYWDWRELLGYSERFAKQKLKNC